MFELPHPLQSCTSCLFLLMRCTEALKPGTRGVAHFLQKSTFWRFVRRTRYFFEIFLANSTQRFANEGLVFANFCACEKSISMRSCAICCLEACCCAGGAILAIRAIHACVFYHFAFPSTLRTFCPKAKRRIFFASAKKLVASVPIWSEQNGSSTAKRSTRLSYGGMDYFMR